MPLSSSAIKLSAPSLPPHGLMYPKLALNLRVTLNPDFPASSSQLLVLQVCITTPGFFCCKGRTARSWLQGVGCRGLAAEGWLQRAGCRGLAEGGWLLGSGCRGLAAGGWLLGAGCRGLAAEGSLQRAGCTGFGLTVEAEAEGRVSEIPCSKP